MCAHLGTIVQQGRCAALNFRACQAHMAIKRVFRMCLSVPQHQVECMWISLLLRSPVGFAKVDFIAAVEQHPVHQLSEQLVGRVFQVQTAHKAQLCLSCVTQAITAHRQIRNRLCPAMGVSIVSKDRTQRLQQGQTTLLA